ncbi:MAG TPA: GNAT family N-acetyltransferase [Candidatus Limnocylindria bacterium]|jgi:GNAT superfamily N-acetyltransferase|nr:GNAT family N-acetyltransferase [Candidatus Limnocylindria bacterium]
MSLGNPERPVGGLAVRAPSGVDLRPLSRSDLADAVRLARELHGLPALPDPEPMRPRLDALLGSVDVAPFLAMDAGSAIGLGVAQFRRRLNFAGFEGWVSDLYVSPEQRGRGVGRALLDALIAEWRLRGGLRLQAKAPDDGGAVEGLYRAAGLQEWMLDFQMRPLVVPSVQLPAGVALRPLVEGDAEAVTTLIGQFGEARKPSPERRDAVQRTFIAHLASTAAGGGYSAVAESDGSVAGVCVIEWQRPFWTHEVHAWLPDLIVDESHRGQGIGRALLADALRHAEAVGAAQVSLESGPQRQAAHGLYRAMGFVQRERTWLLRREPS